MPPVACPILRCHHGLRSTPKRGTLTFWASVAVAHTTASAVDVSACSPGPSILCQGRRRKEEVDTVTDACGFRGRAAWGREIC
ncbi:hypothetical protein NDU88_003910 [Pleurodeles waltl]|uniref:Secreted protein n=1 Tax=Pleurodeles waltl TaxID=8319 RepID=A0AAV7TPX9_PLEWA|nr:hypothetical protein NDU88_003910 [Pleurodeles waltl]